MPISMLCVFLALVVGTASCERAPEKQRPGSEAPRKEYFIKSGTFETAALEFPDLVDENRQRAVPLKVHYPMTGEKFPLVVFSHGAVGNWNANIYQARHLASHGYVVICPEHIYSNTDRFRYYMTQEGGGLTMREATYRIITDPQAVLERPRDIGFAIDQAAVWNQSHADLKGKIDADRVVVTGHSFGAYTTLAVCGARPVMDHLRGNYGTGLYPEDLSDPRVRLGIALSPQGPHSAFFGPESYKTVDRPVVCFSGSRDWQAEGGGGNLPPEERYQAYTLLPPGGKYVVWLTNADHLSFSKRPGRQMRSPARSDVIRICQALTVIFCDYYLKNRESYSRYFNQDFVDSLAGGEVPTIRFEAK